MELFEDFIKPVNKPKNGRGYKDYKDDNFYKFFDAAWKGFTVLFKTSKAQVGLFFCLLIALGVSLKFSSKSFIMKHDFMKKYYEVEPEYVHLRAQDGTVTKELYARRYDPPRFSHHLLKVEMIGLSLLIFFLFGIFKQQREDDLDSIFKMAGIKSSLGKRFILVNKQKNKLFGSETYILKTFGVGPEAFKAKKDTLESAFNKHFSSVKHDFKSGCIILKFKNCELSSKVNLSDFPDKELNSFKFAVGLSASGPIIADLKSMPHMLIAGTTGGGKSVFFKQMLMTLYTQNKEHIELKLVDMKRGVELSEFKDLPHTELVVDLKGATMMLNKACIEMEQRFEYLEKNGYKSIDPVRDNMKRIIIGIDEASEVSGKMPTNQDARDFLDKLAKLGRAAAIHLIFATQKVTKNTIETRIQENISARICFRMNTLQGSMIVLGRKDACELPEIPGRAIWSYGQKMLEVQAPFVSDNEVKNQIASIVDQKFSEIKNEEKSSKKIKNSNKNNNYHLTDEDKK